MTATATATATRTRRNKIFHKQRKSSAHAFDNLYISAPSEKYQHIQSPKSAWSDNRKTDHELFVSVLNSIGWELDKQKISRAEKAEPKFRTCVKNLYTSYTPSYSHQHLSCLTTQRRLHTSHVMLKSRSGVVRDCTNLQPCAKLSR